MRKMIATAVGVVALAFAGVAPVAAGPLDSPPGGGKDKEKLEVEIGGECSAITVTWTNNTDYTFYGDYKVDGEEPLDSDEWGDLWTMVVVPGGGEPVTEVIEFDEDTGDHLVEARWARGPESDWYDWDDWSTAQVGSDCTPAEPTVTQPTCEAPAGSITIPEQERHSYTIGDEPVEAGEHEVEAGDHVVEAYLPKADDPVGEWTLTVDEAPSKDECKPTDEPTEPTDEPTGQPDGNDCDAYADSDDWCDDDHGDYNCPDIDDSHKPIKVLDPNVDPFGLDGDDDGLGCEVPGEDGDDTGDDTGDTGGTDGTAAGTDDGDDELPDTGTGANLALGAAATLAGLGGLGLAIGARRQRVTTTI